jgi:hypothetical protein
MSATVFDRVALRYDDLWTGTAIGRAQRTGAQLLRSSTPAEAALARESLQAAYGEVEA